MATKTEEKSTEDKVTAARNKNLDLALQQIAKDYGDGAIMRLGDATIVDIDVIPTGNILNDRALGWYVTLVAVILHALQLAAAVWLTRGGLSLGDAK
jgi:hypothetical protein